MLFSHDLTKFVKGQYIVIFKSQSIPKNFFVGDRRQSKNLMHFFVLTEIKVTFLIDKKVVCLSDGVEIVKLVEIDKLIELLSWNLSGLVVAFLDQPHFQLAPEHFFHEFVQFATVYRLVFSVWCFDEIDCFQYIFLFNVETVLSFRF